MKNPKKLSLSFTELAFLEKKKEKKSLEKIPIQVYTSHRKSRFHLDSSIYNNKK